MTLLAALVTRAAKHLLVLLLPHALAAFLYQRTHEAVTLPAATRPATRDTVMFENNVRGRLMVGQRFLVPPVGVRVLSPER